MNVLEEPLEASTKELLGAFSFWSIRVFRSIWEHFCVAVWSPLESLRIHLWSLWEQFGEGFWSLLQLLESFGVFENTFVELLGAIWRSFWELLESFAAFGSVLVQHFGVK